MRHAPVLLTQVLEVLAPKAHESYLDLTAGYGGHAAAILDRTKAPHKAVLIDRDAQAVAYLAKRFKGQGTQIVHQDFLSASHELAKRGNKFDIILADLGLSSPHLDQAERGFSLTKTGPLDMRMDTSQELTASQIVNNCSSAELTKILRDYGQESKASSIARKIVSSRPLKTTSELAYTIARTKKFRRSKVHPATRSFQAIRIAVNDELRQLSTSLPVWVDLLAEGGRLAVISFHSLEDRLVKSFLADRTATSYDQQLIALTKKPISAKDDEITSNPRARSAKLRAAVKIKTKKG